MKKVIYTEIDSELAHISPLCPFFFSLTSRPSRLRGSLKNLLPRR